MAGENDWQGITVEEFTETVQELIENAIAEYNDDHKLTAREIAKILGPGTEDAPGVCAMFADYATGTAALGFKVLSSIIKAALPLIPGDD